MSKIARTTPFIIILIAACNISHAQTNKLIAENAELTLISEDYSFTEGPASDANGNVYFTDQPNDQILKWSVDGTLSTFMKPATRANGMYFDEDGNLYYAADEINELRMITPEGEIHTLVNGYAGKRLNGPNDIWIAPNGGIYFTDPFYKRPYWDHSEKEIEEERVYYLSPDHIDLTVAADGFVRPNGIIGTPDGKTLYIADINDQKIYSFTINDDATLSNRKAIIPMGSDGMTLDEEGNIYLTGDGVFVFSKEGEQIEHIPVPENWTANVTFGGSDFKTLFITASDAVYTLEMRVRGAN